MTINDILSLREDYNLKSTDFTYEDINKMELSIDVLQSFLNIYTGIEKLITKYDRTQQDFLFFEDIKRIEDNIEKIYKTLPEGEFGLFNLIYLNKRNWKKTSNFSFNDVNRINHNLKICYQIGLILAENTKFVNTFTFE